MKEIVVFSMLLAKYAFAYDILLKCLFHIPELAVLILTAKCGVLVISWKRICLRVTLRLLMTNLSQFLQK